LYAPIKVDEENYYLKPMNCPEGRWCIKWKQEVTEIYL
jgi:threonyl-tRNA synthetase